MPDLVTPVIPRNVVIRWQGLLASIPQELNICDGTNGAPDLRTKFVKGIVNNSTNPGNTGGSDQVTLVTGQLPAHNHPVTDPKHTHQYNNNERDLTGPGGGKNQSQTFTSGSATTGITTGNTGGGGAHENRPTFYELIYIIKLSDF